MKPKFAWAVVDKKGRWLGVWEKRKEAVGDIKTINPKYQEKFKVVKVKISEVK